MITILNKITLLIVVFLTSYNAAFADCIAEPYSCPQNKPYYFPAGAFWVSNNGMCSYSIGNCEQIIDNLKSENDRASMEKCHSSYGVKRITDFRITSKSAGAGYTYNIYLQVTAAYQCSK